MFGFGFKDEDNRERHGIASNVQNSFSSKPVVTSANGAWPVETVNGINMVAEPSLADPIEAMLEDGMTAFTSNETLTPKNDPLSNRHASLIGDLIKAFEAKEFDVVAQINSLQTDLAEIRKTLAGYRAAHDTLTAPTVFLEPQE